MECGREPDLGAVERVLRSLVIRRLVTGRSEDRTIIRRVDLSGLVGALKEITERRWGMYHEGQVS